MTDFPGNNVDFISDFNGDGYADVITGASGDVSGNGAVSLFAGDPAKTFTEEETLTGVQGFGTVTSFAGDVNNDGYDDILGGPRVRLTLWCTFSTVTKPGR